jgi:predicted O-methyltransferase YrrM
MKPEMRARILTSRLLPIIVFPIRGREVSRVVFRAFRLGLRWLFSSREFANYTYDLTSTNKDYLAWFVSEVTQTPISEIRTYFEELESDSELLAYIQMGLIKHRRGREIDDKPHFGRRLGWYAIVRATKPSLLVETGTEKGLGSLVLARALERNNNGGVLYTLDIEPSAGLLIGDRFAGLIVQKIGDSIRSISDLTNIDFFIHDSDHSAAHELAELNAVRERLSPNAMCLSDNSHVTNVLSEWSKQNGRQFSFFKEEPLAHWYRGGGIGVSRNNL